MKNYKQILKDISKIKIETELYYTHRDELKAHKAKFLDESGQFKKDLYEQFKQERAALEEKQINTEINNTLNIQIKAILVNNLRVAIFNQVIPQLIEFMKKYQGKSYGEKTKQNIKQALALEFPEFYFNIYTNRINFHLKDHYHIFSNTVSEIAIIYQDQENGCSFIDSNNKLNFDSIKLENLSQWYNEYTENPKAHIKALAKQKQKIIKLKEELQKEISAYNKNILGTTKEIPYPNVYIY